jgi:hypothetical protein
MSNVISFAGALKMAIKDLQKPVLSKFEIFISLYTSAKVILTKES